jgi:hypothetical protein
MVSGMAWEATRAALATRAMEYFILLVLRRRGRKVLLI